MKQKQLTIRKEFKTLIPPLSADELAGLEASVVKHGCRDDLIYWVSGGKDILLDGHNRLAICDKHELEYDTVEVKLADLVEAELWIIDNQLARRNLPETVRMRLERKRESLQVGRKGGGQPGNKNNNLQKSTLVKSPKSTSTQTKQKSKVKPTNRRATAAKRAGVGEQKYQRFKHIEDNADEKTIRALDEGKTTINKVYNDLKKKERVAEIKKQAAKDTRELDKTMDTDVIDLKAGKGVFRCMVIDPPWEYADSTGRGAAAGHYPTMDEASLKKLPIASLAHPKGAHLWLWATWPKIRDLVPQRLLKAWGFDWVGEIVWDKEIIGTGRYLRSQTEVLILGVTKKFTLLKSNQGNIFHEKRGRHSAKPEESYRIVERLSPGPRLELFARKPRDGWKRWGFEA